MKKNILFVIPSLHAGGGEKSLVNLLNQIDYNSYNVDLFLFNKSGVFINSLPEQVTILDLPQTYKKFSQTLGASIKDFVSHFKFSLAYYRILFTIKNRFIKNKSKAEQYTWKYISKSIDSLDKEYDVSIGYLEKSSIYFIVDKIKSKKKIGWIHTNYGNSGMDENFDQPYFEKLDNIVTVSEECAVSLKTKFPSLEEKISIIYNIVSPKLINELSNRDVNNDFIIQDGYTNIITVARLSHEKGIDIAINSCKKLIDQGYKIRWYVLGGGPEKSKLEELILNNNLEDNFKLLGIKENPYPYIKQADLYIQPSRYEGKSIAIDEAKILHKPIIVTNYETAKDQINNNENGIIVEMNSEGLSKGIISVIHDVNLQNKIKDSLCNETLGTESEIYKLYDIFK